MVQTGILHLSHYRYQRMGFGSGLQVEKVPLDTNISLSFLSRIATHPVMDSQIPEENVAVGTDVILEASADSVTTYPIRPYDAEETDAQEQSTSFHHPSTIKLRTSMLLRECEIYMNGFPGWDPWCHDHAIHRHKAIRRFVYDKVVPTEETLDRIYDMVLYRNNLSRLAMHLLDVAIISRPDGKSIFDFDRDAFEKRMPRVTWSSYIIAFQYVRYGLLPLPVHPVHDKEGSQGPSWGKPRRYIAAAIALDPSIKDEADMESAVQRMRNCTYL